MLTTITRLDVYGNQFASPMEENVTHVTSGQGFGARCRTEKARVYVTTCGCTGTESITELERTSPVGTQAQKIDIAAADPAGPGEPDKVEQSRKRQTGLAADHYHVARQRYVGCMRVTDGLT